jgi:hypothetical protein
LDFPYQENNLPLMLVDEHFTSTTLTVELTFKDVTVMATLDVTEEMNQKLTAPQRELMLWHQKWANYDMGHVQTLFTTPRDPALIQIIEPKHDKASSCPKPKCAACCLRKTGPASAPTTQFIDTRERNLNDSVTNPGDMIHFDQYMLGLPDRLPTTFGKEKPKKRFSGGTIFVDVKTGFIQHHHQVSLRAGETLQGKNTFEKGSGQLNINIKSFQADDAPFNAAEFKSDIKNKSQDITFSGVGAHHQNGLA